MPSGPPPWQRGSLHTCATIPTPRPLDDHGASPVVFVVFDEALAATHFQRVARLELDRAGVEIPLWVSHRVTLTRLGPLGAAWQTPQMWEPACPFD